VYFSPIHTGAVERSPETTTVFVVDEVMLYMIPALTDEVALETTCMVAPPAMLYGKVNVVLSVAAK
jgi:hypothetical protein